MCVYIHAAHILVKVLFVLKSYLLYGTIKRYIHVQMRHFLFSSLLFGITLHIKLTRCIVRTNLILVAAHVSLLN